jgi:hypothetical protein
MLKSMLLFPLLASVAPAARADELPPEVELVSALGDCAGHAPRLLVTPGEGFKLVLDAARLETSEAQARARYFCTVKLTVNAPFGFQALLPSLEVAGVTEFEAGRGNGNVSARVFFAGSRSHNGFLQLDSDSAAGPFTLAAPAEEPRWSSCATELPLTVLIDASARYVAGGPSEVTTTGASSVTAANGSTALTVQEARVAPLVYRRCPQPRTPAL